MRIGMVVTSFSATDLALAAQVGVTDIVGRYPGTESGSLPQMREKVEAHGMALSVIEGYLPMERVRLGRPGRDEDLEQLKALIQQMDAHDVRVLCYNFMTHRDWTRTRFRVPTRGNAVVNGFDIEDMANAAPSADAGLEAEQMWRNLAWFLERILPMAEDHGVNLAMHPDDPPVPTLFGLPRIMNRVEHFERLLNLSDSPSNGICFCGGSFSAMEIDVPAAIRRLGPGIRYAHFRDVRGGPTRFVETFHDDGQTDMVDAMRAYRDIGFDGIMRPDHVPALEGEQPGEGYAAGYTMLGRLFAVGYMKGLVDATANGA